MKYRIVLIHAVFSLMLCGICLPAQQTAKSQVPVDKGIPKKHSSSPKVKPDQSTKDQETTADVPPSATDQIGAKEHDADAEQFKENIEIQRKLVTVTQRLFWIGFAQGIILIVQAVAFFWTLWILREQVGAQMNAERAWILVIDIGNPAGLYLADNPSYSPGIIYKFKVGGRTPARIIDQGFRFHSVPKKAGSVRNFAAWTKPPEPDLPVVPNYRSQQTPEIPEGGRIILPETVFTIGHGLESVFLSSQEFEELKKGEKAMCAYGFIKYLDAFGRLGNTQFCYVYSFGFGGIITSPDGTVLNPPGFRLGGPPAYNQAT